MVLDELAAALARLPVLGRWVADAACGDVGLDAADTFLADRRPDPDELSTAERVCRRCPVVEECRAYVAEAPVWGLWAGVWHDGRGGRQTAA